MFLESRVPQDARGTWPVLTSAGKLVWASGYPVAEEFAPCPETRTGLLIAEEELDGIEDYFGPWDASKELAAEDCGKHP